MTRNLAKNGSKSTENSHLTFRKFDIWRLHFYLPILPNFERFLYGENRKTSDFFEETYRKISCFSRLDIKMTHFSSILVTVCWTQVLLHRIFAFFGSRPLCAKPRQTRKSFFTTQVSPKRLENRKKTLSNLTLHFLRLPWKKSILLSKDAKLSFLQRFSPSLELENLLRSHAKSHWDINPHFIQKFTLTKCNF